MRGDGDEVEDEQAVCASYIRSDEQGGERESDEIEEWIGALRDSLKREKQSLDRWRWVRIKHLHYHHYCGHGGREALGRLVIVHCKKKKEKGTAGKHSRCQQRQRVNS